MRANHAAQNRPPRASGGSRGCTRRIPELPSLRAPRQRLATPFPRKGCSVPQLGDDPERLLPARHALEIVEGVAPALPMIVPGRPGAMRAEDRILQGEQLVVR